MVVDQFMGQVIVPVPGDGQSDIHSTRLMQRGKK